MTPRSDALALVASQVVQYTGGDTRLGRRVRFGAAVALLALVLRVVVAGGPPKRTAIQEDLRRVGKVAEDIESENGFDEYDVVIVGGGTAGCVLASRLSEDAKVRVLLLEAGRSATNNPLVRTPARFTSLLGTPLVFNFFTTPQQGSGGRSYYFPRGEHGLVSSLLALISEYAAKMLGGCEFECSFEPILYLPPIQVPPSMHRC